MMRVLTMIGLYLLIAVAPGLATAADPVSARLEAAGISIDTVGGLPRFFSDDIRLQWVVPGDADATRRLRELEYTVADEDIGAGIRRTLTSVDSVEGRRLMHHFFLVRSDSLLDGYAVRMELDLVAGAAIELVSTPGFIPEPLPGFGAAYGDVNSVMVGEAGQHTLEAGADGQSEQPLEQGDWFGIRSRFWTALIRSDAAPLIVRLEQQGENLPRLIASPLGNASRLALEFYAGPVESRLLAKVDSNLTDMLFSILWSPFRALCFGMLWLLTVLHSMVGSIGFAIILLSLCVKILMSPLTLIADRLQDSVNKTMAVLQPEIDAIKKSFKGEEAHKKILAVYEHHQVHPMYPMKSLVGFLIQIPVFIAAFEMLGENFALNGASFLWTADLAKPDHWIALPWTLPFFGGYLNLFPCLMTGVTILTSWMQIDPALTPTLVRKQRSRLFLMAGAFFLLFYTFPAGMVLYWTTNNVLHLLKILLGRVRTANSQ
jgi:YidC/Oxa1 family membrane protein insertase